MGNAIAGERVPYGAITTVMPGGVIRVDAVVCPRGYCGTYRDVGDDGVVERCIRCWGEEYDVGTGESVEATHESS